jgi:hypothetical protein
MRVTFHLDVDREVFVDPPAENESATDGHSCRNQTTAGTLGDLAKLVHCNEEALRRIVKSMLDAGERIPGVARIGRSYRVHLPTVEAAWVRGELHSSEMLPPETRQ